MITHFYLAFSDDQGLSEDDVQYLLMLAENSPKIAGEHQTGGGYESGDEARDSTISWVHDARAYEMLKHFIATANSLCGWNYDASKIEGIQVASYSSGQHYNWHIDGDSDHHAARKLLPSDREPPILLNETKDSIFEGLVRKISIIVQLSDGDEYEGGDIYLARPPKDGRLDIHGETLPQFRKKGTVIVFPSYVRHKVEPISKGIRHSAVAWVNGPPFK